MKAHKVQAKAVDNIKAGRHQIVPDPVLAVFTACVGLAAVSMTESWIHPYPHWIGLARLTDLLQHLWRTCIDRNPKVDDTGNGGDVEQIGREHDWRGQVACAIAGDQCALDLSQRHGVHEYSRSSHQP